MDSEKQGLTLLEVERSVSDDVDRPSTSQSVDRGHFGENLACLDLNPSRTASTLEINHDTTLFDIKEGLMALTGSFKRFVDANTCNTNVNVEHENEQPFTIVRPNMNLSSVTNPRKRAREYFDETVSICPSHNSFVGKDNEEEALSAVVSDNPNGARARGSTSDSRGIDLSSLFSEEKKSDPPEETVPQLNMEDEIFDSINDDLLSEYDSELGDPLKSEKVATKVSKIWSNPNVKGLNKIFKRHKQPSNLKPLSAPSMPRLIRKMPSFKDPFKSNEKKLYSMHQSVSKAAQIATKIADSILSAEKQSVSVDSKSLILHAFDIINLLASANLSIINKRKSNVRPILDQDCQGMCDASNTVSEHLFGDDIEKVIKQEKEAKRIARRAVRNPTSYNQNNQSNNNFSRIQGQQGRSQRGSFLSRGKSRPFRSRQSYRK